MAQVIVQTRVGANRLRWAWWLTFAGVIALMLFLFFLIGCIGAGDCPRRDYLSGSFAITALGLFLVAVGIEASLFRSFSSNRRIGLVALSVLQGVLAYVAGFCIYVGLLK